MVRFWTAPDHGPVPDEIQLRALRDRVKSAGSHPDGVRDLITGLNPASLFVLCWGRRSPVFFFFFYNVPPI